MRSTSAMRRSPCSSTRTRRATRTARRARPRSPSRRVSARCSRSVSEASTRIRCMVVGADGPIVVGREIFGPGASIAPGVPFGSGSGAVTFQVGDRRRRRDRCGRRRVVAPTACPRGTAARRVPGAAAARTCRLRTSRRALADRVLLVGVVRVVPGARSEGGGPRVGRGRDVRGGLRHAPSPARPVSDRGDPDDPRRRRRRCRAPGVRRRDHGDRSVGRDRRGARTGHDARSPTSGW